MIWQATEGTRCDRSALRTHIASEISSSCGDLSLDPSHVQELAQGVSTFCTEQLPDKHVKSDYLMLLTSLSLWAAGEEHAAWRVLGRRSASAIQRHMVLPSLSQGKLSPSAWSAFACGILRPSHWVSRNPSVVWVLDLSRIRLGDTELYELTYYKGIRQLITNLAELWDASSGEGILGFGRNTGAGQAVSGC